jgi:DNA-binding NarL/FixJ family response regulator
MNKVIIISHSRLYAEGISCMLESRSTIFRDFRKVVLDTGSNILNLIKPNKEQDFLVFCFNRKRQLDLIQSKNPYIRQVPSVCIAALPSLVDSEYLASYEFNHIFSDNVLPEVLVKTCEQLYLGRKCTDHAFEASSGGLDIQEKYNLTKRETEVLFLISRAYNNKEIGRRLYISDQTVSVHRKNLMKKLGVHNAAGLISKAFREELIKL